MSRRQREQPPAARDAPFSLEELRVAPGGAVRTADLPSVAIVVLNYEGLRHLDGCFESLRALDYPAERLEVILVDNGSTDGSQAHVRAKHAWVRLIENQENLGFSAACNQGALGQRRRGARVPEQRHARRARLAARARRADRARRVPGDHGQDALVGRQADQLGRRRHELPRHRHPARVHARARAAVRRAAQDALRLRRRDGDACARSSSTWAASTRSSSPTTRTSTWAGACGCSGHEVHYVPTAVCYHHHSSTSKTFPPETVRLLQVRNPLLACFKNYDDENLRARPAGALRALSCGACCWSPGSTTTARSASSASRAARTRAVKAPGSSSACASACAARGPRPARRGRT